MKVKISPTEDFRFNDLFLHDNEGNIILPDDMKGVFGQEMNMRFSYFSRYSPDYFLIIHNADKMIDFLENAKRVTTMRNWEMQKIKVHSQSKELFMNEQNRIFYNSIKNIIKKIKKENK